MIKVAVFPAGSEIGLEINRALKYSTHIELYGLTSVPDHSEYVYKNHTSELPYYYDSSFIEKLNQYIEKNKIDYIFPAHDDVQLFLTEHLSHIHAEVITSELETVKILRSKINTYNYFNKYDFIPKFISSKEISEVNDLQYPLFAKPDIGQGSKGAVKVNSPEELKFKIDNKDNLVICEFLPGEEYTIDCFSDLDGNLRVTRMRNRHRIKNGISVNSKLLKIDQKVIEIAKIINEQLKLQGAWFFQLKRDNNNQYKLLEIAPRVSGTMGLSRNTGVNFPLLSIFNKMGKRIEIIENNYKIEVDRALFSRYKIDIEFDTVFLDLDDTLIINNKVNTFLMMFIYQIMNQGKSIYLLTKHQYNVSDTLKEYHISEELFKDIIHIKEHEKKSIYISSTKSIFIDDSFSERLDVSLNSEIPVFDSSEIESLIDWRL